MNLDSLYEINSLQACNIILNILDNFNNNYEKNLEILKKIMVFLEDRDFKNPYSSIIGSLSNVKRLEENTENISDASHFKNLLKLKQYVYERCQIAYIANKLAIGYKETEIYNLNKYVKYIPIKGNLQKKLFNLDKDKIKIYKEIKGWFRPVDRGFKINVLSSLRTRKKTLRKYLIKNQITVNVVSYIYCHFENYLNELSKDIFKYYIFLSKSERESSKLFPGIAKIPDLETLYFLKIDKIDEPLKLIELKLIREENIKNENPLESGIFFLYDQGINIEIIAELIEKEKEFVEKIINKNNPQTDRAKQFLDELL